MYAVLDQKLDPKYLLELDQHLIHFKYKVDDFVNQDMIAIKILDSGKDLIDQLLDFLEETVTLNFRDFEDPELEQVLAKELLINSLEALGIDGENEIEIEISLSEALAKNQTFNLKHLCETTTILGHFKHYKFSDILHRRSLETDAYDSLEKLSESLLREFKNLDFHEAPYLSEYEIEPNNYKSFLLKELILTNQQLFPSGDQMHFADINYLKTLGLDILN